MSLSPEKYRDRIILVALQDAICATFDDALWIKFGVLTDPIIVDAATGVFSYNIFNQTDNRRDVSDTLDALSAVLPVDHLLAAARSLVDFEDALLAISPRTYSALKAAEASTVLELLDDYAELHNLEPIQDEIMRIRKAAREDPSQCIGAAKDLLESTMKIIIRERSGSVDQLSVLDLAKDVMSHLGLKSLPDDDDSKQIVSSLTSLVRGVAHHRNDVGTGHGRPERIRLDSATARLAADASATASLFFLELWAIRRNTESM